MEQIWLYRRVKAFQNGGAFLHLRRDCAVLPVGKHFDFVFDARKSSVFYRFDRDFGGSAFRSGDIHGNQRNERAE